MAYDNIYEEWNKRKLFKLEKDRLKQIKYIYIPFLNFQTSALLPLLSRSHIIYDLNARLFRNKGQNVLQGFGINNLGYNYLSRQKSSNIKPNKEQLNNQTSEIKQIGIGYDLDKFINTNNLEFVKFVQQVFSLLFSKKIINYEQVNYLFCDKLNRIVNECEYSLLDIETTSKMKNEELVLDFSKYASRIFILLDRINMPSTYKNMLKESLKPTNVMNICLSDFDKHIKLEISLEEPQYISGINFICLNPNKIDIFKYLDEDELDCIKKYIEKPNELGVFSGIVLRNPLDNNEIPIIISYKYPEDIHIGIPCISSEDYVFATEMDLAITNVIEENIIVNSDFLSNLEITEAKKLIIDTFISEDIATLATIYKYTKIIVSSIDPFGVLIPLIYDDEDKSLIKKNIPIYLHKNMKKVFKQDNVLVEEPDLVEGSLSNIFINGLGSLFIKYYDSKFNIKFPLEDNSIVDEISMVICRKEELFNEVFMPIIFNEIFKDILDMDYLGEIKNVIVVNDILRSNIDLKNTQFFDEILNLHTPDSYRLYALNCDINQNFNIENLEIKKFDDYLKGIKKIYSNGFSNSSTIDEIFLELKKQINNNLRKYKYDKVVELHLLFYLEVLTNYQMTKEEALEYLVILSIFAPFTCEEIYQKVFNPNGFILYEPWPVE